MSLILSGTGRFQVSVDFIIIIMAGKRYERELKGRRFYSRKGGFPLSRKILRAYYVRKKHARKQFPLLRKIILLRCLFYVRLRAFSPYKRFGPWVENKKSGNLI